MSYIIIAIVVILIVIITWYFLSVLKHIAIPKKMIITTNHLLIKPLKYFINLSWSYIFILNYMLSLTKYEKRY